MQTYVLPQGAQTLVFPYWRIKLTTSCTHKASTLPSELCLPIVGIPRVRGGKLLVLTGPIFCSPKADFDPLLIAW